MSRDTVDQRRDRITITRSRAEGPRRPRRGWGPQLWSVGVWLIVIMALGWTVVQLNDASSAPATTPAGSPKVIPQAADSDGLPSAFMPSGEAKLAGPEPSPVSPVQAQGPALNVPEEVVAMFHQRQEDLERREKSVRTAEERFTMLRADIELILGKVEAAEQRRLRSKEQQEKAVVQKGGAAALQSAAQKKQAVELHAQKYSQLTKIYESMPAEEAAARIEKMPDRKALEILRLVKGKTAGSILGYVKVDRAAKLTEQLLSNP